MALQTNRFTPEQRVELERRMAERKKDNPVRPSASVTGRNPPDSLPKATGRIGVSPLAMGQVPTQGGKGGCCGR